MTQGVLDLMCALVRWDADSRWVQGAQGWGSLDVRGGCQQMKVRNVTPGLRAYKTIETIKFPRIHAQLPGGLTG